MQQHPNTNRLGSVPKRSKNSTDTAPPVHPDILDVALRYPQGFMIPVDHLSCRGLTEAFAAALVATNRVGRDWVLTFNRAFAQYRQRSETLNAAAPDTWLPPRRQNLWIVSDRVRARPYHQPFGDASWVLDVGDFVPGCSNAEFGTYMLLHAERLAASKDMAKAIVGGMSYWATRPEAQLLEFCAATATVPRLDASVFTRLAKAMPWVRALFHPRPRPPPKSVRTQLKIVPEGSLMIPVTFGAELERLVVDVRRSAHDVVHNHHQRAIRPAEAERLRTKRCSLTEWLKETQPRLLVADAEQRIVWDPEDPHDVSTLETALHGAAPAAIHSIVGDLATISDRSTSFLRSVRYPELLPRACRHLESTGGIYVNAQRHMITYSLGQPGFDALQEPAPAYHRLLLGARTIHEWGHLAQTAGWVAIPSALRSEVAAAKKRISAAMQAIVDAAPYGLRDTARASAALYDETPGGLAVLEIERRLPDYLSNLLATHYLPTSELEVYARANIRTHLHNDTRLSLISLLTRHALEYQYLKFAAVDAPLPYCLNSTWLATSLLGTGVVQRAHLEEFFQATAQLCNCGRVAEAAFFPPYNRPME